MKKRKKWFKNRLRYIFKTITYKTLSVIITILAGWVLTGNMAIGLSLGMVEITIKLFIYWLHELAWHKIDYGKDFKIKYIKQRKKKRRVKKLIN